MKKSIWIFIIICLFGIGIFSKKIVPIVNSYFWHYTNDDKLKYKNFIIELPKMWWVIFNDEKEPIIVNSPYSLTDDFYPIFIYLDNSQNIDSIFYNNGVTTEVKNLFKCSEYKLLINRTNIICKSLQADLLLSALQVDISSKEKFYHLLRKISITHKTH